MRRHLSAVPLPAGELPAVAAAPRPGAGPAAVAAVPGCSSPQVAHAAAVKGAHVEVVDLDVGYAGPRGYRPVLAAVDLRLEPGRCLAVVGESGCGKSTLLHVLAGLLAPLQGTVDVDGSRVAAPGVAVPGHAAYLFQQDLLLPWQSVLGNAMFAAQVARPGIGEGAQIEGRARALLDEFGLGDRLDAFPRELSGGMRQRVALARTLVLGRGLVLLDEPFANLDALTRGDMQQWMLRVMRTHPATWVLVTHDVAEAVLLGDSVAVLSGRPARLTGRIDVAAHDPARVVAEVHRLLREGRST
jgi:putative hydroxymethylpyrimidine transport system ATP-binding protein